MNIKLLIAGEGGQGVQTIAEVLCYAVFKNGLHTSHIPNYGLEQRGGSSLSFIQISDKEIWYAKFSEPDILLILSESAKERVENYITKSKEVIDVKNFDLSEIRQESYNIFFCGLLCEKLKKYLDHSEVLELLRRKLEKKPDWEKNADAFKRGLNFFV